MDTRPIGIFDSGLGGLTVAKEIYKALPGEATVYIGDTARVPYGNRSPETIINFSRELVRALIAKNVKAIVVACATASSLALETIQKENPGLLIMGVIEAATKKALKLTKSGHIGVIGTRATITSRSFESAIEQVAVHHPKTITYKFDAIITHALACPLFVPVIEEGILEGPILDSVIDHYLSSMRQDKIDTLIMGCTHYPIIREKIGIYLPHTQLINVGEATAEILRQELMLRKMTNQNPLPQHSYYATDVTDNFTRVANIFLGNNQPILPKKITL